MVDERTIETYRSLRDTIRNVPGDVPIRSVLIVDVDRPTPSTVARRLAESFNNAGEQCVLVDTNFRNGGGATAGLSDLIANPETNIDVDRSQGFPVIGPGTLSRPDLLSSSEIRSALATVAKKFEYLVLMCDDYPATGDAIAIAPVVDAAIVVVSAGVTGRQPAIQARDALERVGTRILGMVMVERPRRWF